MEDRDDENVIEPTQFDSTDILDLRIAVASTMARYEDLGKSGPFADLFVKRAREMDALYRRLSSVTRLIEPPF